MLDPIPPIAISLFENERDPDPKIATVSWADLCSELGSADQVGPGPCPGHSCERKKGAAWSPTIFDGPRGNSNARAVSCLVLDLDSPTDAAMGAIAARLESLQLAYFCHATHTTGSYRLAIPFEIAVSAGLFPRVRAGALALLGAAPDPATGDLARLYYLPTIHDGATLETFDAQGRALKIEECLKALPANSNSAPEKLLGNFAENFSTSQSEPIDIASIKADLRKVRKHDSKVVAARMFSGEALAGVGERDVTINRAASVLATATKAPISLAAAMAILSPTIRAMGEALQPEGLEAWLQKASDSFERALERRIANDKSVEETRKRMLKILGRDANTAAQEAYGNESPEEEEGWRKSLIYALDTQGQPASLKPVGANVDLILRYDPAWRGALAFNEITKDIDVLRGPLVGVPTSSRDTETANWLSRSDYKITMRSFDVGEQLLAVARKNTINPLKTYLESLKWDGIARARFLFEKYYHASGDFVHNENIGRKWLISCVARALDPGCKVDTVLLLQGRQSAGKSRSLRILGGEWFSDMPIDPRDKDSRLMLSRFWLVELAELTTLKRHDVETLKSFFSASDDFIRPPYGRVGEIFKRRCVYVGTTNADEMLVDVTGNRRYWPIEVGDSIDLEALAQDRDQLWAEAVVAYKAGERWHLDDREAEVAERVAQAYVQTSHYEEPVLNFFLRLRPEARPVRVSISEIATKALGMTADRMQHGAYIEIGHALRKLNFRKQRVRQGGALVWIHHTPENILKAQVLGRGEVVLSVVANSKANEGGDL